MAYLGNGLNNDFDVNRYKYVAGTAEPGYDGSLTTFPCVYDKTVELHINGIKIAQDEFTHTSGVDIEIPGGTTAGYVIEIMAFSTWRADNHYDTGEVDTLLAGKASTADNIIKTTTPLSISAMLDGTISLSNTISSIGFDTTLYTGTGVSHNVVTGVDMVSNWDDYSGLALWTAGTYNAGDVRYILDSSNRKLRVVCLANGVTSDPNTLLTFTDATFSDWKIESKTFGGRVWIKNRGGVVDHTISDTIRGGGKRILSNQTTAELTDTNGLALFNSDGFNLNTASSASNANLVNYVSWTDQTTFCESFLTSHNKPAIRETNVVTGYVQIKYKGSGLAGHEVEHGMGRELAFRITKNLTVITGWLVQGESVGSQETGDYLALNTTAGVANDPAGSGSISTTENVVLGLSTWANTLNNQYIMYGYTNSYIDGTGELQGNYEIGTYQGTGSAGNKIRTRGKPAYILIKRIDVAADWLIFDNQRQAGNLDGLLRPNLSNTEIITTDYMSFNESSINLISSDINAAGGEYLYMVIYDNDNASGSSKYDQPTDTTQLQINATLSTSKGFNSTNGADNKINTFNGTVTPTGGWK